MSTESEVNKITILLYDFTCWERADLLALLSLSHWYPGSGVVLDCIDS